MSHSLKNKRIIISKTNQIGDVLFALPLASALKKAEPSCHIIFLARDYTRSLILQYHDVDEFADWAAMAILETPKAIDALRQLRADIIIEVNPQRELAKLAAAAGIKMRIGTSHRLYNWLWCNKRVHISRKRSPLHETQLDMQYLAPLLGKKNYSLAEIIALRRFKPFSAEQKQSIQQWLAPDKFNLILHPKTRGQHTEWSPQHFAELIKLLSREQFHILVTGSATEGDQVRESMLSPFPHVVDVCGKISLDELIALIAHVDGLVCASTGPVHLAAAFSIHTLGLYAPIKPFDAGRWGPVGPAAEVLCVAKNCEACRYTPRCLCIDEITPAQVFEKIMRWYNSQ